MVAVVACPQIVAQFFDNNGNPAVGGSLLTQVGGVNYPTYSDHNGTTALPNPINLNSRGEVSTAAGASSQLFVIPNIAYVFTLYDANGNQLWSAPYVNGTAATAASIGALLYPQSAAEIAASVTPTNLQWIYGDPRRYGAVLNGTTDDTAALTNWAKVGGQLTFPSLTAFISSAIALYSNTTISASKGSEILTSDGSFSMFSGASVNDVVIQGLKFVNTGTGVALGGVVSHVLLEGCTNCTVRDCEFIGMRLGGITFDGCGYCHADTNRFSAGLYASTQQESVDVGIYGFSSAKGSYGCTATNNNCYGGGCFGIAIQDEYTNLNPANNIVSGNRIGNCLLYGVIVYMPSFAAIDTRNQIIGNYIENVQGTTAIISGSAGAGIYVVGGAAGGTLVANNEIVNCCIDTAARSLAPAGIGISATNGSLTFSASVAGATSGTLSGIVSTWNGSSGSYIANFSNGQQRSVTLTNGSSAVTWTGALSGSPAVTTATLDPSYNTGITVTGNIISGMTQYDGILVISNISGVTVTGNTVNMPPANTTGYALHIENSSSVTASANVLRNQGLDATIYVESTGINTAYITITGNQVLGGADASSTGCIQITGDGSAYCASLNVSDNQVVPNSGGAGNAGIWINNSSVKGGKVSGNYVNVATMPALVVVGCTGLRVSDNILETTGSAAISLSGTCTGSFFDKTNFVSGGYITNTATGFPVHQLGSNPPSTGTAAIGDTVYNVTPAATATSFASTCTTAGLNASVAVWTGLTLP